MRSALLEQNSGKFWQEKPTAISNAISVAATNTQTEAVSIPLGAYVTKVQVLCTATVANCDIDVGDGDNPDRYIDEIGGMTQYDIVTAPNVAAGTTAAGERSGRYYAAADTIDVDENTTGSANDATGTIKILVWYYL